MKVLLKLQFQSVIYSMFSQGSGRANARGRRSFGRMLPMPLLILLMVGSFSFFFLALFQTCASVLLPSGNDTVYFLLTFLLTFIMGVIGSVFITEKTLFGAEDNEFLLSLPLRPIQILLSRLCTLYVLDFFFGAVALVPAFGVWASMRSFSALQFASFICALLFLPLMALSLSVLLGWLFAWALRKVKAKNALRTASSMVLLLVYLAFYTDLQGILQHVLKDPGAVLARCRLFTPYLYFGGRALGEGDVLSFLLFALFALVPAGLILMILSRSFLKLATASVNTAQYKYKKKTLKSASVKSAMFKKELQRLFGTPAYFINSCFGAFLFLLFDVGVLIKGGAMLSSFGSSQAGVLAKLGSEFTPLAFAMIASFLCAMTVTTNSALSLEGKMFDVMKSMPLTYTDVVLPKIAVNMVMGGVPTVLLSIICLFRCHFSLRDMLLVLLLPLLTQAVIAVWGMFANVMLPRFDWTSEITVVKQSSACLVGVFGGLLLVVGEVVFCVVLFASLKDYFAASALIFPLVSVFLLFFLGLNILLLATAGKAKYKRL